MRVLYLDLGMGAAGDMLSAALFELLSRKEQEDYLSAMNHLGLDGVSVQADFLNCSPEKSRKTICPR